MDMNLFRKHLARQQNLTEAPQLDGRVLNVTWYGQTSGESTIQVHQKHDKGPHSVDEACFQLLKKHLGPPLRALTKLKIDNTPIRTSTGNYHLVTVEFETKRG